VALKQNSYVFRQKLRISAHTFLVLAPWPSPKFPTAAWAGYSNSLFYEKGWVPLGWSQSGADFCLFVSSPVHLSPIHSHSHGIGVQF